MKGSNVLAFLGGVLVGGIAALLMAPQSGEETRGQIKDMADEGYNSARRRYGEAKEGLRRDAGIIKDAARGAVEDVKRRIEEARTGIAGEPAPTAPAEEQA